MMHAEAPESAAANEQRPLKYRLNRGLLIWTLIVLAVVAGGSYGARRFFMVRNAGLFLEQAEKAETDGELQRAAQFYSHYLLMTRENADTPQWTKKRADVLMKLGGVLEQLEMTPGNAQRIALSYEEALRLNPELDDARRRLIPLLTRMRRFTGALHHVSHLEDLLTKAAGQRPLEPAEQAELAELKFRAARCQELMGDVTQAQKNYLAAIHRQPQQLAPYLGLARVWASEHQATDFSTGENDWPELRALKDSIPRGGAKPTQSAVTLLLDRMVEAHPGVAADAARAEFLLSLKLVSDASPVSSTAAELKAAEVLKDADADEDGVLSGRERWHAAAPTLADADGDGRVTAAELAERHREGDRLARRRAASSTLKSLAAAGTEDLRSTHCQVLLSYVGVTLDEAAAAPQLKPETRQEMIDELRQLIRQASEQDPEEARYQLLLAEFELRSAAPEEPPAQAVERIAQAEASLRRGLALMEKRPYIPLPDEWQSPLGYVNPAVTQLQLYYALGQLLVSKAALDPATAEGSLAEVQRIVAELRRVDADIRLPFILEFRMAMLRPERAPLLEMAKVLRKDVGTSTLMARDAASMLGGLYVSLGDPGAALDVYQRQLKADPGWLAGRIALAEVLVGMDKPTEAIPIYESVLGAPGVAQRLALVLMLTEARRPPHVRDWPRVDTVLSLAESSAEDPAELVPLRAEFLGLHAATLYRRAFDEKNPNLQDEARRLLQTAEERLRTALQAEPDRLVLWTALASTVLRRDDRPLTERLEQLSALLSEARENVGPHAELCLLELNAAKLRSPDSGRETAERLVTELDNLPEEGRLRLALALSQSFVEAGQLDESRRLLYRQAVALPNDLDLHRTVSQALLQDFQPDDAEWQQQWTATLERIEALEGTPQGYVMLAKAQRLVTQIGLLRSSAGNQPLSVEAQRAMEQDLKSARDMLAIARRTRPHVAAIRRVQGFLEELTGEQSRRPAAIEAYQQAMDLGDRSQAVVGRLVTLYLESGRSDEADRLLARIAAEQADALSGNLGRLAFQTALQRREYDQAVEAITRVAERTDSDRDRLTAALIRFARGERDEGILRPLRKAAYELSPQAPEAWMLLVLYYVRGDEWDAAKLTVRDAAERLKEPTARNLMAVARLHELLAMNAAPSQDQHWQAATSLYEQAQQEHPTDAEVLFRLTEHYLQTNAVAQAVKQLGELLEPTRAVPVQVREWARRQRASLQARSGRYEDARSALDELESLRTSSGDQSVANLREQLKLLLRMPSDEALSRQAVLLKELDAKESLRPEDRLLYATVLVRLNRWDDARGQFRTLLDAQPEWTLARIEYSRALLQQAAANPELLEAATRELNLIQGVEPRSWRSVSLQARLLAAQGKTEDAARLVAAFATERFEARNKDRFALALKQENARDLFRIVLAASPQTERAAMAKSLNAVIALWQAGKFAEASQRLSSEPVADEVETLLLTDLLECARTVEPWNPSAAEKLFEQSLAAGDGPDAPRELARFLIVSNRMDDAIRVCEGHWDRITPLGMGFLMSLVVRDGREPPAAVLQQWHDRLMAQAEELPSSERGLLYLHLGNFANEQGRFDDAIVAYRRANVSAGVRFDSLNNFAFLSARTGRELDAAAEAIATALQMAGPRPDLLDTKAAVLIAQGRFDEARNVLQPLIAKRDDAALRFRLAECYFRQNEAALAAETLESALRKGLTEKDLHPLDQKLLQEMQVGPTAP
jgi:predicted Zn-dependent protease